MISQRSVVACLALLLLAACSATSFAQRSASQPAVIPSPKSVLGFTPGDNRTIAGWSQITDYFERLDRASDRVLVQTLGQSTLKRPLIVAFISARENILALPKYKEIQQQLADPRKITQDIQRDRLLANGKVVVTISCSIHSTEIVASQMSMQLAYELATAQDVDTRAILENTILLLIPSPNPDGIDIVADWYRKTLGTPHEGKEPPELYHHYAGHDDNRDWFMLNLKETQLVTRLLWHEWFPQIVYDVHQQGSNGSRFFIPPFYDPPNPQISPLLLRQVGLIGHKIAADLQAAGFKGVLTNALYDTWWHGGFRTAPYFHNSIGILSEAASARLMSPATVTTEQLARSSTRGMHNATEVTTNFPDPWPAGEWRPRDIMAMEMISARSILEIAAKFRVEYLRNFYELGRTNIESKDGPQVYLIPAGQGRDEAVAKLIGSLVDQGVEVYRLDRELHMILAAPILRRTNPVAEKLGSYRRLANLTSSQMQEVPLGSYIIFLAQPQRTNVLALFEPQIYPNRLTGQGEAERPYDVAGWTLPMQMGVEAPVVMAIREPAGERKLTLLKDANEVRADLALALKKGDESPIKNPVKQPVRVGIYKGWTSNMDEGWTRYIFDTFNVPYTSVRDADMRKGALSSKFDALIFTSQAATQIINGNGVGTMPQEYTGGITEAGVKNLKEFVNNGGMLICFDNACDMAIKEFNLPVRNTLEGVRSSEFYCPGSIVALDIDNKNPIGSSLPPKLPAYFINSSAFAAAADANVRVIARYAKENVLLSGWLLGEDKLSGQIALAEVNVGKGRIVLFGFRPQHRGQAWATLPFIWNALSTAANNTSEE